MSEIFFTREIAIRSSTNECAKLRVEFDNCIEADESPMVGPAALDDLTRESQG